MPRHTTRRPVAFVFIACLAALVMDAATAHASGSDAPAPYSATGIVGMD